MRNYGDGGTLCDNLDGSGNVIGAGQCIVVTNDDPGAVDKYSFRGSTGQNLKLDDLAGFGWDPRYLGLK